LFIPRRPQPWPPLAFSEETRRLLGRADEVLQDSREVIEWSRALLEWRTSLGETCDGGAADR
jgi:hypothetical protein